MRPNIHIKDMVEFYVRALFWTDEAVDGRIYNAGYYNLKVREIAALVKKVLGDKIEIVSTPSDDPRSYHISSDKIRRELGFEAKFSVEDAIKDLLVAFQSGKIPNSKNDIRYYNIRTMKAVHL